MKLNKKPLPAIILLFMGTLLSKTAWLLPPEKNKLKKFNLAPKASRKNLPSMFLSPGYGYPLLL
jgi:hypothetical protein